MPEQSTSRANPVATSGAEAQPFETHLVRLGVAGLNLNDEIDVMKEGQLVRMTNGDHDESGSIVARAGQTSFATASGIHHSVRKLRDPQAGTVTRIWGCGTQLFRGASGALTLIDSGYSGDPLALVPHRPPLSGDSWMFVGDRLRMRKVRGDGLDLPIGLPAPSAAATAVLATEYRTNIAACDASDGTQASAWTGAPGKDEEGNASGVPITEDSPVTPTGVGSCVRYRTTVGASPVVRSYDTWWGLPKAMDLTLLTEVGGAATVPATDDDIIHLWTFLSLPHLIEEVRLYFVIDPIFNPLVLPGTIGAAPGNADAYVKGFRRDDFAQFVRGAQSQIDAAETARVHALRDQDLKDRAVSDFRDTWEDLRAVTDPARRLSLQASSGSYQWVEFGTIGLPLRRGDFQRIGVTAGRNWSTVTGIILYLRMATDAIDSVGVIGLDDVYLTGGFGPDTADPGQQKYDWRCTNYDPRTGCESNGSPIMSTGNYLDAMRRRITVTPHGVPGDGGLRQRIYRRGGSQFDDWFFEGANTSNGGAFTDDLTDDAVAAAGSMPIDHFQPVPTVTETGATVLAQEVPALWGPVEGMLFACGDPYRPGHVYFCVPDQPDHWSAFGLTEVCAPSEELMNGGLLGHQAFVISRAQLYMLYPNLSGTVGTVTAAPTLCKRGLWSRWGFAVGPKGVYFVSEDGVFVSSGGPEEWISRDIDPLFRGKTVRGYAPINKSDAAAIRLSIWENKLYFQYSDTNGAQQVMVYSLLRDFWRHYDFGVDPRSLQGEEEEVLLIGTALGVTFSHSGTSDNGSPINVTVRTGAFNGGRREEKLLGDMIVDADRQATTLTVTNFLNEESITNGTQAIDAGSGRQRYILTGFGDSPQKAHSISTEISWASGGVSPIVYQLGYAITVQPEITTARVTNWDDLGHPDEKWVTGITFDVDTGGVERTILIERDFGNSRILVDTLLVNTANRHKVTFSWLAVPAQMVRVRPTDDCKFWLLYRADWIFQIEPPRISKWDIHFENAWDQYYTGLDLYCDTLGTEKRVEVYVDQVMLQNTLAGLPYWPIVANGRRVVHLTLPWGRGHVFRFRAIDANPGLLYQHRWHLQEEPSEQANWNQNFSIYSTRADKWLKAIIFECDTFDQVKQVQVEVDGTVVQTLSVRANGRSVVQIALTDQHLGRVWRMFPIDGNPGRLYTAQPIFDEEPFKLDRWETQETNHSLPGWFFPVYGHITVKSTADVTLTVALQINQRGTTVTEEYVIPSTDGQKLRHYQSFRTDKGGKGVLIKYLLTSPEPFWLYREETVVVVQPWGAESPVTVQPFGSDDLDPSRPMRQSVYAAAAPGGALGDNPTGQV